MLLSKKFIFYLNHIKVNHDKILLRAFITIIYNYDLLGVYI